MIDVSFLCCRDRIIKYGHSSLKDRLLSLEMDYSEVIRCQSLRDILIDFYTMAEIANFIITNCL